jgi:hypothetical protein
MIVHSTPSSITCEVKPGGRVQFTGEWTLEPKFYLDVPSTAHWMGTFPRKELTPSELKHALDVLLGDARDKGWAIELAFAPE